MKCEECLPLLEEFSDGEVDRQTNQLMDAHLAACAECAEAFDALRAEQELYLRYEREVEVPPAMWHAVRARIEEVPAPVRSPKPLPLWSRLREQLALVVGALSVRPALASSMALLAVGLAAGALWLAQAPRPEPQDTLARSTPDQIITMPVQPERPTVAPPDEVASIDSADAVTPAPKDYPALNGAASRPAKMLKAGGAPARGPSDTSGAGSAFVPSDNHLEGKEDPLLSARPSMLDDDVLAIDTRLLDPEEKDVARHIEQAQMLLRSFRNARYSEGEGATNIAYEKTMSRKLLDENRSLQFEAETSGNKTTRRVLNSLEPFLLDISNLRDEPSRDEVRSIKERMQKKEIIASLQVY